MGTSMERLWLCQCMHSFDWWSTMFWWGLSRHVRPWYSVDCVLDWWLIIWRCSAASSLALSECCGTLIFLLLFYAAYIHYTQYEVEPLFCKTRLLSDCITPCIIWVASRTRLLNARFIPYVACTRNSHFYMHLCVWLVRVCALRTRGSGCRRFAY